MGAALRVVENKGDDVEAIPRVADAKGEVGANPRVVSTNTRRSRAATRWNLCCDWSIIIFDCVAARKLEEKVNS